MYKGILIEGRSNIIYKFIKKAILNIILIVLASSYHTCVSDASSCEHSVLKMFVSSSMDKHIKVRFNLAKGVGMVNLANYKIRVTVYPVETDNTNSVVKYCTRLGNWEAGADVERKLNEFSNETDLASNKKPLILPFILVPSKNATKLSVVFILLDSSGRIVDKSIVSWCNGLEAFNNSISSVSTEDVSNCLASVVKEKTDGKLLENNNLFSAIQASGPILKADNKDETNNFRKRKYILENNNNEAHGLNGFLEKEKEFKKVYTGQVTSGKVVDGKEEQNMQMSAAKRIVLSAISVQEIYPQLAEYTLESQFNIACMLEYGIGLTKDPIQAFEMFKSIATHGHVEAHFKVACMLGKRSRC
jgi:hypothetical protein